MAETNLLFDIEKIKIAKAKAISEKKYEYATLLRNREKQLLKLNETKAASCQIQND